MHEHEFQVEGSVRTSSLSCHGRGWVFVYTFGSLAVPALQVLQVLAVFVRRFSRCLCVVR